MAKNPFKKKGITDTLINVGIGGAANVAMDYVVSSVESLSSLDPKTINAIKIGVGVLGGTMTTNKMVRAAVDGIATVGVSNLVASLMDGTTSTSTSTPKTAGGIPNGTIGAFRFGNRNFVKRGNRSVSGLNVDVMGK